MRSLAVALVSLGISLMACGGDPFTAALETAVTGDGGATGDAGPVWAPALAWDAGLADLMGQSEANHAAGETGSGSHDAGTSPDVVAEAVTPVEAGPAEVGPAEVSPPSCTTVADLSNIGTGDFHIEFTLVTTETGLTLGLVNQRTGCDTSSPFWDVVLSPAGGIIGSTDDAVHYVSVEAGDSVNDGKPHRIVVARTAGLLWYSNDGTVRSATVADNYSFRVLTPLVRGTDPCPGTTPLAGHGTMTDLCITTP